MKASKFRELMAQYAEFLTDVGAIQASGRITKFASCFPKKSSASLSDILAFLREEIVVEAPHNSGHSVGRLVQDIQALVKMLKATSTATKLLPLTQISEFLETLPDMDLERLLASMNEVLAPPADIVDFYVTRLNARYKDSEKFKALFEQLKSDKRVKAPEALAIARAFSNYARASGKKADALESIWDKYRHYAESAAIGAAMNGKSAA
jgi:hypothetical protein